MTDEDLRPLLNDEQWRAAVAPDGPLLILAAAPEELLACMREYVKRKRELHAMDFDDLLVNGLRVLSEYVILLLRMEEDRGRDPAARKGNG